MNRYSHGWGLNTMLIMVGVIIIALLVATFFAIRINNMLGQENNESEQKLQSTINEVYYINKINDMNDATSKYVADMGINLSNDPIRIDLDTLVSYGYINPVIDYITSNKCIGYSKISITNQIKNVNSYLYCDNYKSKGYGGN